MRTYLGLTLFTALYVALWFVSVPPVDREIRSPLPKEFVVPTVTPRIRVATESAGIPGKKWQGVASYYSRSGCVGCSPSMTMANGFPLRDESYTVAFNRLPLGSFVFVRNLKNGKAVPAVVTDRGGFEKLGRIIDVTEAVRDYIECADLCRVEVIEFTGL